MGLFPTDILLATDGSEDAALAASAAVALSNRTGSKLHVAHAWQFVTSHLTYPGVASDVLHWLHEREARKLLDVQVERIEEEIGGTLVEAHLVMGPPMDAILDLCEELKPVLVVLGSRGLGPVERLLVGSVSEGVVHHASCPVLVVRGGREAWPPGRIVLGDDYSENANRAEELAASIGALFGARALLVRAYPDISRSTHLPQGEHDLYERAVRNLLQQEERVLEERAHELQKLLGRRPEVRVAADDAATAILEATGGEESTLIAVGLQGTGHNEPHQVGERVHQVLRAARGPVLIHPLKTLS